jgi:hypothetical protein
VVLESSRINPGRSVVRLWAFGIRGCAPALAQVTAENVEISRMSDGRR